MLELERQTPGELGSASVCGQGGMGDDLEDAWWVSRSAAGTLASWVQRVMVCLEDGGWVSLSAEFDGDTPGVLGSAKNGDC